MQEKGMREAGDVGVTEYEPRTQFQVVLSVSEGSKINRDPIYADFDARRDADILLKRSVTTMFMKDTAVKLTFENFSDEDALPVVNRTLQLLGLDPVTELTKLS